MRQLQITVGAAGFATNGGCSTISLGPIMYGGGAGGYDDNGVGIAGNPGASGGGASAVDLGKAGCSGFIAGQGNAGGCSFAACFYETAGGGGGFCTRGGNGLTNCAGNGGSGLPSSFGGVSCIYSAGGGGASRNSCDTGGSAGSIYAGQGAKQEGPAPRDHTNGCPNSGSGGGGAGYGSTGGSGIVIIAYPDSGYCGFGGTVTKSGGCVVHTFLSSGLFVANARSG